MVNPSDTARTAFDLEAHLHEHGTAEWDHFPLPGRGDTARRHELLVRIGTIDLSLARVAEAHLDATAILREAGRAPRATELYGVWASDGPAGRLIAERVSAHEYQLQGAKQYCSGSALVSNALVTAHAGESLLLFEVPMASSGIRVQQSNWRSAAFADTSTCTVSFNDVHLPASARVGDDNWYLTRPGFWHGALGPAACWAGGAISLIDAGTKLQRKDPHSRAHLGALASLEWSLRALLDQAGREIDADPSDHKQRCV